MGEAALVQKARLFARLPSPAMRRTIRMASGLSLAEVAGVFGVSSQTVANWERRPRLYTSHLRGYVELLEKLRTLKPIDAEHDRPERLTYGVPGYVWNESLRRYSYRGVAPLDPLRSANDLGIVYRLSITRCVDWEWLTPLDEPQGSGLPPGGGARHADRPTVMNEPVALDWLPEGVTLVRTCKALPEQYELFVLDQQVGYIRLRHGWFAAWSPDDDGMLVHEEEYEPGGLKDQGEFLANDRDPALRRAVAACLDGLELAPAT